MNDDNIKINIEELMIISQEMKKNRTKIFELYQSEYKPLINKNVNYIKPIDEDAFTLIKNLNQIYSNINEKLIYLTNFLEKDVALNYDSITETIYDKFDNILVNEINELLNSKNNESTNNIN